MKKQQKSEQTDLIKQEKLDKEFRHQLYLTEGLTSECYSLADIIKDYIDKKIKLTLENNVLWKKTDKK